MPGVTEILDGLSAIANQAKSLAVAWHIAIAMALMAHASGWHPSQRTARLLIGMLLASVAGLAIAFSNPFNGFVFSASALVLTAIAMGRDGDPLTRRSTWTRRVGAAMM
jgi:hypothetical protein